MSDLSLSPRAVFIHLRKYGGGRPALMSNKHNLAQDSDEAEQAAEAHRPSLITFATAMVLYMHITGRLELVMHSE